MSSKEVIDLTEDAKTGTGREGDTAKGTAKSTANNRTTKGAGNKGTGKKAAAKPTVKRARAVREQGSDSASESDNRTVRLPKKKAKSAKKAKAAKKVHFEGWFGSSQLEAFVSRHELLTDWPLRMVFQSKLKKYCLLANPHGRHWYMLLVNNTVSPGYYAMLNSMSGTSTNPMIENNLRGLENLSPRSVPKQQNGSDCGAYFARFAELVSGRNTSKPAWSDVVPKRMSENDVTEADVRRIRADVGAN
jgi:hypothetical protein